jgi:hypothetical protein
MIFRLKQVRSILLRFNDLDNVKNVGMALVAILNGNMNFKYLCPGWPQGPSLHYQHNVFENIFSTIRLKIIK